MISGQIHPMTLDTNDSDIESEHDNGTDMGNKTPTLPALIHGTKSHTTMTNAYNTCQADRTEMISKALHPQSSTPAQGHKIPYTDGQLGQTPPQIDPFQTPTPGHCLEDNKTITQATGVTVHNDPLQAHSAGSCHLITQEMNHNGPTGLTTSLAQNTAITQGNGMVQHNHVPNLYAPKTHIYQGQQGSLRVTAPGFCSQGRMTNNILPDVKSHVPGTHFQVSGMTQNHQTDPLKSGAMYPNPQTVNIAPTYGTNQQFNSNTPQIQHMYPHTSEPENLTRAVQNSYGDTHTNSYPSHYTPPQTQGMAYLGNFKPQINRPTNPPNFSPQCTYIHQPVLPHLMTEVTADM